MGVLVAIAIPIFTAQLEKARDAVTESNIRSAYAEAQAAYLTGESDNTQITVTKDTNNVVTSVAVAGVAAKGTQTNTSFGTELPADLPTSCKAMDSAPGSYTITFTYDPTTHQLTTSAAKA